MVSGGRGLVSALAGEFLDDGAVAVRDAVIVAVGPHTELAGKWPPDRVLHAAGKVVAPGFVDGHVHLEAFLGAARPYAPAAGPGPFSGTGQVEVILPMVARGFSMPVLDELVRAVVRPALAGMLLLGSPVSSQR